MIVLQSVLEEAITIEMDLLIEDLINKHIELGQKATGKWIESLSYEIRGTTAYVFGADYTQFLTDGRSGGSRPPISPLELWVKAKLKKSGKEARSIAFAVAKKIEKEGTSWHPDGSDLISSVITEERKNQIIENISEYLAVRVSKDLEEEILKM